MVHSIGLALDISAQVVIALRGIPGTLHVKQIRIDHWSGKRVDAGKSQTGPGFWDTAPPDLWRSRGRLDSYPLAR